MTKYLFFLVSYLVSFTALAHPVIYKDGIVISSFNMSSFSDNQLLYTFSPRSAAGLNHWRFTRDEKNTEFALARFNHLLWRHNGESSQANFYLLSGAGVVDSEIEKRATKGAFMGGAELDWETRTLYTSLKHYYFTSPAVTDLSMTQARVGLSPFESDFEHLQSWIMVQAMVMPKVDSKVSITPMMRFFYRNVLWEIGASTRGDWMLNLMVHL